MFGRIVDLYVAPYEPPPGVDHLAAWFTPLRRQPYAMLLLSGGELDCAGYSLLGWDPFLVLKTKGRGVEVSWGNEERIYQADPFPVLEGGLGSLGRAETRELPRFDDLLGDYQVGALRSNFTREAYLQAVGRIREYIRQGDVYQVNLSQRFSFPFTGESYSLFRRLFALHPAPFYAYLNCRDFVILSTSMERFLYRQDDYLETRPIKGTRPRGKNPEGDAAFRRD